jgi:hypothetical protein
MRDLKRTNEARSPGADPTVTMLLRAAYAPPADDDYWAGLQQRIVSRLQDAPSVTCWSAICEWRTVGLVAATLALLVSGATIMRDQALDATSRRIAAGTVYVNPAEVPEGVPVVITVHARDSVPQNMPERFLNPFEP